MDEQRLTEIEAKAFAFGCIARLFIAKIYQSQPDKLAEMRDDVCNAIEAFYEDRLSDRGHPFLQLAIVEAEALLGPIAPQQPKPDR